MNVVKKIKREVKLTWKSGKVQIVQLTDKEIAHMVQSRKTDPFSPSIYILG